VGELKVHSHHTERRYHLGRNRVIAQAFTRFARWIHSPVRIIKETFVLTPLPPWGTDVAMEEEGSTRLHLDGDMYRAALHQARRSRDGVDLTVAYVRWQSRANGKRTRSRDVRDALV
jgi:hypothetical protein